MKNVTRNIISCLRGDLPLKYIFAKRYYLSYEERRNIFDYLGIDYVGF